MASVIQKIDQEIIINNIASSKLILSPEQQDILQLKIDDFIILLIKAYAGSGKTFMLKQLAQKFSDRSFLYFVYNKSMQREALKAFKKIPNVRIVTFHGYALSKVTGYNFMSRLDNGDLTPLDTKKYFMHTEDEISTEDELRYAGGLITLINEFCASSDSMDRFIGKKKRESQAWSIKNQVPLNIVIKHLKKVWEDILNNEYMPITHDLYLKVFQLQGHEIEEGIIMVDEAQDITPCMTDIILKQDNSKRKIFVGDDFQEIYSFRGAVNSLKYIEGAYTPVVKYLSTSYRCPPHIALIADSIISRIGAHKSFKSGVMTQLESWDIGKQKTIIARTNGSILRYCMDEVVQSEKAPRIFYVGGLKNYISDIMDILNIKSNKEYIKNKLFMRFGTMKELDTYARETKNVSILSALVIIYGMISKEENIYEMLSLLKENECKKMSDADIVVATAHKSKGSEWKHVELLDDFPIIDEKDLEEMPSEKFEEEMRLLYVAVTRAEISIRMNFQVPDFP